MLGYQLCGGDRHPPQGRGAVHTCFRSEESVEHLPSGPLWGQLTGLGKWDQVAEVFQSLLCEVGTQDSKMCGTSPPSVGHWFQEFPEGLTSHFNMLMCGN